MAATSQTSARLTAAGSVALAAVLATFTVTGPWQPASVLLGWVAVVAVAYSMVSGLPGGLVTAGLLVIARVGIHGLAGDRTPGLVLSAVLLLAVVELGAASFELRTMPWGLSSVVTRVAVIGVGSGVLVATVGGGLPAPSDRGQLLGLAAAFLCGLTVLWAWRQDPAQESGPDGVGD